MEVLADIRMLNLNAQSIRLGVGMIPIKLPLQSFVGPDAADVREILGKGEGFITEGEVATELEITRTQARRWLDRLVKEGLWEKLRRPVRYRRIS